MEPKPSIHRVNLTKQHAAADSYSAAAADSYSAAAAGSYSAAAAAACSAVAATVVAATAAILAVAAAGLAVPVEPDALGCQDESAELDVLVVLVPVDPELAPADSDVPVDFEPVDVLVDLHALIDFETVVDLVDLYSPADPDLLDVALEATTAYSAEQCCCCCLRQS